MPKTIAILHALDANDSHVAILLKKLGYFMERMSIYPDEIRVNDVPYIGANNPGNDEIPSTLVIGWGLSEKPRWTRWSYEIKTSSLIMSIMEQMVGC